MHTIGVALNNVPTTDSLCSFSLVVKLILGKALATGVNILGIRLIKLILTAMIAPRPNREFTLNNLCSTLSTKKFSFDEGRRLTDKIAAMRFIWYSKLLASCLRLLSLVTKASLAAPRTLM
jgi:hypothetical protein